MKIWTFPFKDVFVSLFIIRTFNFFEVYNPHIFNFEEVSDVRVGVKILGEESLIKERKSKPIYIDVGLYSGANPKIL